MDFEVVINKAESTHKGEGRKGTQDIKIAGDRPEHRGRKGREKNHQTAHRRRADFGPFIETRDTLIFALLPKIDRTQFFDQPRADNETEDKSGSGGHHGAEGDVAKHPKRRKNITQFM